MTTTTTTPSRTAGRGTRYEGSTGALVGVASIAAALLAAGLRVAGASPVVALAPLALLAALLSAGALGLYRAAPRTATGWLVVVALVVAPVAPAVGAWGTWVRLGVAVAATIAVGASAGPRPHLPRAARAGLLMLGLALVMAALGASSTFYGVARLVNWVMFFPLFMLMVRRPGTASAAAWGAVASACVQMAGVGLQVAGLVSGTWGGLLVVGTQYDRASAEWLTRYTGWVMNPNDLATILVVAIVVAVCAIIRGEAIHTSAALATLVAVFVWGIVLTGSRGGLVSLAAAIAVICILRGPRALAVVAAGTLAATVAAAAVVRSGVPSLTRLLGSFGEIFGARDPSAIARDAVWSGRLSQAGSRTFLIGDGFGGYAPELFSAQRSLDVNSSAASLATVDNSWLKLFLETGTIGALGLALVVGAAIVGVHRQVRHGSRDVGVALAAVLTALIVRSFTVDMLDVNPWNAVWPVVLGLAIGGAARWDRSDGMTPRQPEGTGR